MGIEAAGKARADEGMVGGAVHDAGGPVAISDGQERIGWYPYYALGVLLLVYIFNFVDRQILAVLAEDIKADLGVSDAQLGFLYGTAFAVFYATFGVAFGRLADTWNRTKLITLGLGFWSLMTTASGLARGFLPLAACRFGVGVGEASASPAAFSLLYDYFPPRLRTTALGIYSSGISIGSGLGLFLGGLILKAWADHFPDPALAPLGLRGWQAAFIAVGVPGIVMALWVSTLREPPRGGRDGIVSRDHPHPFRETGAMLAGMVPLFNWPGLLRDGGRKAVMVNLVAGLAIILSAAGLVQLTRDLPQWIAMAIGFYAVFSWGQTLALRDPVVFGLLFRGRSLIRIILGGSATVFMLPALMFWFVPFLQRFYGVNSGEAGAVMGAAYAGLGLGGVLVGGVVADRLRKRLPKGKLIIWLAGMGTSLLAAFISLTTHYLPLAYGAMFIAHFGASVAYGPWISMVNDLMLPRGRATVSAFAYMVNTMIGIALGPYLIGQVSDMLAASGMQSGEALRQAMLTGLAVTVVGVIVVLTVLRHFEEDEENLVDRAKALGESM
ncbi:spinster family MFS transporter [Niveispirillum sp.]